MTSFTSASNRSRLSNDDSLVTMDISNSVSTWIPFSGSPSFTLIKFPLWLAEREYRDIETAVEPVMPVFLFDDFILRPREVITVTELTLCIGSPPLVALE